ncbi:antitoxin YezG family protein [Jiangella alkaliphila]|uniref:DUF600 family protein n=1 Tax=Jiangella alkaliphila TaxID=419479 RepID=A0A1H2H182_9ACTN|nr:hypothetical protein [Jiangella alkaliphila]SDU25581.1 hypothetical protein SAMN04488563_0785 [Jiangella alkaliphila]
MNLETTKALLNEIGKAMVRSSPDGWRTITLKVTAAANMMTSALDVELSDGSHDTSAAIDSDGDDALDELRDALYQEDTGTWYNATFIVSEGGDLDYTYDYDNPPYGGMADDPTNTGSAARELLLYDHEMFPRDDANLPIWHPARLAHSD